jgi:IS605 OrfB family transposase
MEELEKTPIIEGGKRMLTKVVRIPLISDNEPLIDYKSVNKELQGLQENVRAAKNRTIQLLWEWGNYGNAYTKEYGIYPKAADVLPLKTIGGNINAFLKNEYPNMYSANLSTALRMAVKDFQNAIADVQEGTRSIIEYKANSPIELHNKTITLKRDEAGNYQCTLALFSLLYRKEKVLPTSSLRFKMLIRDNSQREIVDRCIDREYKVGASKLLYNKKKKQWFLNLSYTFSPAKGCDTDSEKIMGVDLGIACVAYMSFRFCEDRYQIDGGEITNFRHGIERRKRDLQRQGKTCGDGRIGHGVKTRIARTERLNDIISNFRNTANHKYARYIVEMAKKHGCGVIQMEDLKEVAGDDLFLKEWTYFDLRTKIEYKAKEAGIELRFVAPAYTSQRCCKCGNIDKGNRPKGEKGQAYFKCTVCGFQANADYNASQNIATKGIDEIICRTRKENSANRNRT